MDITTLERNDVPGALAIWKHALAGGGVYYEITHTLLKLQDDPADLMRGMAEVAKSMPDATASEYPEE